ncbi:MAG TPA: carboxy terminal-processing peptidase [Planctomycetia bacterium]|nr:carboxy terminal-processing peptidase [Planctomycetia bacterium]
MTRFRIPFALALASALTAPLFAQATAPAQRQPPKPPRPVVIDPVNEKDHEIVKSVGGFLETVHFKQHKIDQEISRRMHKLYIEGLDPRKLFFLASDIAEFAAHELRHERYVQTGDLGFAIEVEKRYLKRLEERNEWAQEFANEKYDFSQDDVVVVDGKSADYAKDEADAKARWKSWIKYEMLNLIVDGTKEEDARERIRKRYRTLVRYAKQVEKDEILERYMTSLSLSFDPHSTYMSPKSQEEFEISMRLQLQGIGALLSSEDGKTVIKEIIPGGAADADKRLKVGDQITGVGQGDAGAVTDVDDFKIGNVVKLIRGEAGSVVRLEVIPSGAQKREIYRLVRQKVMLTEKEAKGEIIETPRPPLPGQEPGAKAPPYRVGVIKLPSFYADADALRAGIADAKSASGDMEKILRDFNEKNVDAVVVDLRFNGGGLLTEAIKVTGLFIDEGPIVQVKDFRGSTKPYEDEIPGVKYRGPLVVLVNKFSASASEIFAGAIQDYRRGLIVGDSSTHGKGSVQQIIDIGERFRRQAEPNMGALKVTLQMFYRVNGDSTQNRGVLSDVVLPSRTDSERYSEAKLDYALEFDKIPERPHAVFGNTSTETIAQVKRLSQERRSANDEMKKFEKRVGRYRELAERKSVTFNEAKLKTLRAEFGELKDEDDDDDAPTKGGAPAKKKVEKKFGSDVYDREVLGIVSDFIRLQPADLTAR